MALSCKEIRYWSQPCLTGTGLTESGAIGDREVSVTPQPLLPTSSCLLALAETLLIRSEDGAEESGDDAPQRSFSDADLPWRRAPPARVMTRRGGPYRFRI